MNQTSAAAGIRAVLRSGRSTERGEGADVELFDSVTLAVEAGARRLRSASGTAAGGDLRIAVDVAEIDVDTGRPISASGDRLAALLGAARSGQLLLSGAAAALVAAPPDDVGLADLGSHRFHGVPGSLAVFELQGDGLASSPIRTIETVARSVPLPPTPLIGRNALLTDVIESVRVARVVTLTGSGGSGKTRLAIEAALANAGAFDTIHWTELAPLGSDATLLDALAAQVGIHHQSTDGRRLAVIDALGHGRQLLVLDNAEHLIEAVAGMVTDLAERCTDLHILVTSREPMGLAAETVRRIPPLTVASDDGPAAIATSEAGLFLVDRLDRAGVKVPADDATARAIHRICVRLDGIPLALELAAARAALTPLHVLSDGLDDRFGILSATRRDAQPHQRTLEASIRWSHDLLPEDERVTFRRLAVFSGSFEPADAAEVDGGHAAPGSLNRLVERSLVTLTSDGQLRLLETVRAFAEDRLDESGETRSVRDRHLAWVLTRAEAMAPGFDGPEPAAAAAAVRRILNDARAAIHHAERTSQPDAIWRLIDLLAPLCFYDGLIDEALEWSAGATAVDDGTHPEARAPGLVATALLATSRGDHAEIVDALERATEAAELVDDRRSQGRAVLLGAAHDTWHRPAESLPMLIRGRDLCASSADPAWAAWGSCGAALALTFLGRPADALTHLEEADAAASRLRSRRLALDADARRCICEYQLGRWGGARRTIERGRQLAQGFTSISVTACFDAVDAWLAIAEGRFDAASESMDDAIAKYLRAGELQFIPLFVDARARALIDAGSAAEAAESLLTLRSHPGVAWSSIYRHWLDHTLADAYLAGGDIDAARTVADRLVADASEIGNLLDAARGELLLARLDHQVGEPRRADTRTAAALDKLWGLEAIPATLDALELSGRDDEVGGRADRATAIASGVLDARQHLLEGCAPDLTGLIEIARRGRGDRQRPTFGWDSLTPTELAVTELVADGLTNPQIAERLIVGRATVKTHVSNVLRKLDLAGRTQLATAYRQRTTEREDTRRGAADPT
ncbi:MAG TPA: LuxR C-terminal-related transcriptional regulator [Microthrixaceae bacterium]|nr:LuxR C-terminal-related transcriptional regulator [Microthrixaceae bacterium]